LLYRFFSIIPIYKKLHEQSCRNKPRAYHRKLLPEEKNFNMLYFISEQTLIPTVQMVCMYKIRTSYLLLECELLLHPLGFKDIAVSFESRPLFIENYITDSDRLNPLCHRPPWHRNAPQAALIFSHSALYILKHSVLFPLKFDVHQRALNMVDFVLATRTYTR
jgi:hypothetical protein